MHLDSSISSEGRPLTMAGRMAATGHRATTVGRSHMLATRSWLILGGLVCCTTMAMSAWPPQLISQQEVDRCTRLGMSSLMNSACRSSIRALTAPEASVPGMSQCSQPWVWAMLETELPVPPTGKPLLVRASTSGSTRAGSVTMYSMLERIVKRTWPSAYSSAMSHSLRMVKRSIWRWVPARTVQIWSPLWATWCSTPGRGRSWYFQLP